MRSDRTNQHLIEDQDQMEYRYNDVHIQRQCYYPAQLQRQQSIQMNYQYPVRQIEVQGHLPPLPLNPPLHQKLNQQQVHYITVDQYQGIFCRVCSQQTASIHRKVNGKTAWIWIILLFVLTFIFFWLPLVIESCQDISVYCAKCRNLKAKFSASCCC